MLILFEIYPKYVFHHCILTRLSWSRATPCYSVTQIIWIYMLISLQVTCFSAGVTMSFELYSNVSYLFSSWINTIGFVHLFFNLSPAGFSFNIMLCIDKKRFKIDIIYTLQIKLLCLFCQLLQSISVISWYLASINFFYIS